MTTIAIGADHAGFDLKAKLIDYLQQHDRAYQDIGTRGTDPVDYPDYAHAVCSMIFGIPAIDIGILICGTGLGMSIVANRHNHIRCAVATSVEMACLARRHNNANVLALGARLISDAMAIEIVETFLNTDYEGGRHEVRLKKINVKIGFGLSAAG